MNNYSIPASQGLVSKVWKKITDLHLCDLNNINHHVSSLLNALPVMPNWNRGQVHASGPYTSPVHPEEHYISLCLDSSDYLLSLSDEPELPRALPIMASTLIILQ
jgi:hypothetical protein